MKKLYEAFMDIATRFPGAIAYQGRAGFRTYAQMAADVDACANDLNTWPIGLQQRVAVSSGPAYPVFVLELACSRHGATVVFLDGFRALNSAVHDGLRSALVSEIRSRLQAQLDATRRPTHLVLRSTPLPKGSNGKIHRTALRASVLADEMVAL